MSSKIKVAGMFLLREHEEPMRLEVRHLRVDATKQPDPYYRNPSGFHGLALPKGPRGYIVLGGDSALTGSRALHRRSIEIYAYHGDQLFRAQIVDLYVESSELQQHAPYAQIRVDFTCARVANWVESEPPEFLEVPEKVVSVIGHEDPDCDYYGFRHDREF